MLLARISFYTGDLGLQAKKWIVRRISYFIWYKPMITESRENKLIKILIVVGPRSTNVILEYIQAEEGNTSPRA